MATQDTARFNLALGSLSKEFEDEIDRSYFSEKGEDCEGRLYDFKSFFQNYIKEQLDYLFIPIIEDHLRRLENNHREYEKED